MIREFEMNKTIEIAKNRAKDKFPYYSPVLMARTVESNEVPTMGITRSLVIYYNKDFVDNNSNNLPSLLVHEGMHVVYDHHRRFEISQHFGKVSPLIANIAMDMEINQYLKEESSYIMKNGWLPSMMDYPEGRAFEDYLSMLLSDMEDQKGKSSSGSGSNSNSSGNGSQTDSYDSPSDMSKDEILDQLNNIQELFKMGQKLSGGLSKSVNEIIMDKGGNSDNEELVDTLKQEIDELIKQGGCGSSEGFSKITREIVAKKYDWKQVLSAVIKNRVSGRKNGRNNTTYTEVNRRLSSLSNIIFPNHYDEVLTYNLVVGIDTSGSMGSLVDEMYARLKSIQKSIDCELKLTVVECDCAIQKVFSNFNLNSKKIESQGFGGTDMEEIPRWVEKQISERKMKEPDQIIIMTDNYCSWTGASKLKKKISVLTNNRSDDCPYKQYDVVI